MGVYKHIRELWKKPRDSLGNVWKERLIDWRKEPTTIRIERPTRLDKARSLGYRAKQGIFMIRQRVNRGGRKRATIRAGRRSKHYGQRKDVSKSYQVVAEERTSKKYPNCEVLNSYYAGEDGVHYWYEVILVDTAHPQIRNDKSLKFLTEPAHRGRAHRGLTSAGKKSRGLHGKGKGHEKVRPSHRAKKRIAY